MWKSGKKGWLDWRVLIRECFSLRPACSQEQFCADSGCACVPHCFNRVWLSATPWTVAHQAPLSVGFSRREHWSGLPWPPPGNLPNPGMKPTSLMSPALAGRFFTTRPPGKLSWGCCCSVVQSLSHGWLFVTPWTEGCQASLSFTISQSLLKLMSIEMVMPSNHLILCYPLLRTSAFNLSQHQGLFQWVDSSQ